MPDETIIPPPNPPTPPTPATPARPVAEILQQMDAVQREMETLRGELGALEQEQRLADLDRQRTRLEEDRGDADRLTRDAADALARLEPEPDAEARRLQDNAREAVVR